MSIYWGIFFKADLKTILQIVGRPFPGDSKNPKKNLLFLSEPNKQYGTKSFPEAASIMKICLPLFEETFAFHFVEN